MAREKLTELMCQNMQRDYCEVYCENPPCDIVVEAVDNLLANNVVIQKQGQWRWGENSMKQYGAWCTECECGWVCNEGDFDRVQGLVISHKYCPECGAKMEVE